MKAQWARLGALLGFAFLASSAFSATPLRLLKAPPAVERSLRTSTLAQAPECAPGMGALDTARKRCQREWTLLIYMAADNDLGPYAREDLIEMVRSKLIDRKETVDIVFEIDTEFDDGSRRGVVTSEAFQILDTLPELDSGRPEALESFLSWGVQIAPSRHYAVVLWGHGNGWGGGEAAPNVPQGKLGTGIAIDEKTGSWMTVPWVRYALDKVRAEHLDGRAFDLYAADACLMQMAEIVYEFRDTARFVFGSVPVMDFQGLPYAFLVRRFMQGTYDFTNERDGAYALALELPQLVERHYRKSNDKLMASSVSSQALQGSRQSPGLAQVFDELGESALGWLEVDPFRGLLVQEVLGRVTSYQPNVYDLYQLLAAWDARLSEEKSDASTRRLRTALTAAQQSVLRAVVAASYGDAYSRTPLAGWSRGLSVWFPQNLQEYRRSAPFLATGYLYRSSSREGELNGWARFLERLYAP